MTKGKLIVTIEYDKIDTDASDETCELVLSTDLAAVIRKAIRRREMNEEVDNFTVTGVYPSSYFPELK